MTTTTVHLTVNGQPIEAVVDPDTTLLEFLRVELGLFGAKNGCSEGTCGACTVLINGKARRSCLTKLGRIAGSSIETIEDLSDGDQLHPLQYTMITENAIQCGFCTPGIVMAGKALLDRNPDPSADDIKRALKGNLCRCTGYRPIIAAVQEAAKLLSAGVTSVQAEGLWPKDDQVVGTDVIRLEAVDKATGRLRYSADKSAPGMLHAKALRSAYPHARITGLDTSKAEAASGVVAVLTASDVPGRNGFGLHLKDQPVFAEYYVRTLGDAIAAVIAESEHQAEAALDLIEVEYQPLAVIDTPQAALSTEALALHQNGNLIHRVQVNKGDIEIGFAQADVVVEGEYTTPFIEQAYIEPEAGLAVPDGDCINLYVGSQGPTNDHSSLCDVLDLPSQRVRVVHMPMGGGFGGKEDITVHAIVALGALKTGRPVRFVWSRQESLLCSTKRHAETMHYRTGATSDGRLVALEADIVADGGAYASVSEKVIFRSAVFAGGPYVIPHVRVDARVAYTNNPPGGAMRGFGSPQVAFAAESQMDLLAEALGMDPIELRLKNILEPGKATITGQVLEHSVGARAALEAVRDQLAASPLPVAGPGRQLGVGVACAYKNVGFGGGGRDSAGARLELLSDGSLLVRHGAMDMGQGCDTVMAQIAAQTLGVPLHRVQVHAGDTANDPDGGQTTASRQTFVTGNAVRIAALNLRDDLCSAVARSHDLPSEAIILAGGVFRRSADDTAVATLDDFSHEAAREGREYSAEHVYAAPQTFPIPEKIVADPKGDTAAPPLQYAYCFGAQAAIIAVDEETHEIEVLKVIAAQDVGQAINPKSVIGQMEGALVMGLGYALSEEFRLAEGRPLSDRLGKLGLLRIDKLPELHTIIVTDPHPDGPFGAKGMSELPISPTAPAVANAVAQAVGARVRSLPITKDKIALATT